MIEQACAEMPEVRAVIFAPEGAPPPEAMPNATVRPRLTLMRALLLVTVDRYLGRARLQEVRDGISELEIQKLAYFLQLLGAPLRLSFTRGRYGPYAEKLSHVLDALEGHYLTGLGDRSSRVTELVPINIMPGTTDEAGALLDAHPEDAAWVDAVLDLVDGFETPYSLELLATVHFASIQAPVTTDPGVLADRVADWSLRKARLFTATHVSIGATQLHERGLLGWVRP
jgi:hypothetical protein